MSYFAATDSVSYLAAQLALLVLRAGVSRELPLATDRFIFAPSPTTISFEDATQRLAQMAKPVLCRGNAAEGVLSIHCQPLADAEPHEQQWYRLERDEAAKRGSYLWYLDEQYGASDAHPILALGRQGESLLLPSKAVDTWFRDYEIHDVNSVGDDVGNPWSTDNPVYQEAKRRGAHGLLRFSSPADNKDPITVITFPLDEPMSEKEREARAGSFVEIARHLGQVLKSERESNARRPSQTPPSALELDEQLSEYREAIRGLAAAMRQHYSGTTPPPEVSDFLAECALRSWCRPQN